jgi:hypothetical protein
MPLNRHVDAATFLAGLARNGTKLVFGASQRGQQGVGHIGNRGVADWEELLKFVGFQKDPIATHQAQKLLQEFNHKSNTQVYWYRPLVLSP